MRELRSFVGAGGNPVTAVHSIRSGRTVCGSGLAIGALPAKQFTEELKYHTAKTPQDQILLKRQIDAADRQIDQLVYELYGLTDEEIRIVEANA
ncbi:MAG TPA: hypothetical protein VMG10_18140 [Gemmataceae bacterium]|nr:hypothetical protein [Gemmataceae bacterium]